jgi:hypothetical protein
MHLKLPEGQWDSLNAWYTARRVYLRSCCLFWARQQERRQVASSRGEPENANTTTFNVVAWMTAISGIVLTLVLAYAAVFQGTPSN